MEFRIWNLEFEVTTDGRVGSLLQTQIGPKELGRLGLTVGDFFFTDAELIAAEAVGTMALPSILKRLGIHAGSIKPAPPMIMALVVGLSVVTTTKQAMAATRQTDPDNMIAYKAYINKYMNYLERAASMGLNTDRFLPPMLFPKWLNRDTSGAWWQQ